jgi:uncharacterized protein (TIGR02266 family)
MSSERRQGVRLPVQIWVEERTDRELYFQRSANLSAGGIYLENTIPHPVGTQVNLRFTLPDGSEQFEVKAEVVSALTGEEEMGMALKFLNLQEPQVARIRDYIAGRK